MKDNNRRKENEELESKGDKKEESELMGWIKSIALAIVVALFIKTFLFSSTYVKGDSMKPTLHEKDRLFSVKVTLLVNDPERGDIVVLEAPDDPKKDYIKRVIGVGGDLVEIVEGRVIVNQNVLEEDYIGGNVYTDVYNQDTWEVPEGEVFVLGDNRARNASKDSRSFGTIDVDDIKGITSFRYFPFSDGRFGSID